MLVHPLIEIFGESMPWSSPKIVALLLNTKVLAP